MTNPITIAIHGGAGTILKSSLTPQLEDEYTESLKQSLNAGYQINGLISKRASLFDLSSPQKLPYLHSLIEGFV